MELIACTTGDWQQAVDGSVICSGTLEIVAETGPFGLPPLTYGQANELLGACLLLWATVWGCKKLFGLIR